MPSTILESVERGIANDLLQIVDIYEMYNASQQGWVTFYTRTADATQSLRESVGGPDGEAAFLSSPREIVRTVLNLMIPSARDLLAEIRQLETASEFALSDLYERISRLEVKRVVEPDHKGFFVLASKAIEDASGEQKETDFGEEDIDEPS